MSVHASATFRIFGGLAALSTLTVFGFAQSTDKPAAPPSDVHPVMIELFTSEGCSSCPPADIILQKLDEYQPIQGAQLIVLSEHVTYWDHDGWKDPNSSQPLTDRQSAYEAVLRLPSPYTPQMIVDGSQEVHVDKTQEMEAILEKEKLVPKVPIRISNVVVDPSDPTILKAHIDADTNFEKSADVYVAIALEHVESQVLRGENGGQHLVHVAVVRKLTKVGKLSKGKNFSTDFQLKLEAGEDPKNLRLIAFAQESGPGMIIGTAEWKAVKSAPPPPVNASVQTKP